MPASFRSRPITGTGFRTNRALVPAWDPIAKRHYWKSLVWYHSLLVNCLATSGLLGFAAGLWLLLSGVWATVDRLAEQSGTGVDPDSFVNVRAAVLVLASSYPFGALDGALQGYHPPTIGWFVALAILYAPSVRDRRRVAAGHADAVMPGPVQTPAESLLLWCLEARRSERSFGSGDRLDFAVIDENVGGVDGAFHHMSAQHLTRSADEFDWRYNMPSRSVTPTSTPSPPRFLASSASASRIGGLTGPRKPKDAPRSEHSLARVVMAPGALQLELPYEEEV